MDLAFLLPARFLCSARCAASRYEVRFACDRVQRRLLGGHLRPAIAYPMNAKLKAYGFAPLAVLLAALLMAWASGLAWYHLGCLRKDFSLVQSESFHLAEHVEEKLLALNGTLRHLGVPPDPAVLADFQRQASEMKLWLQTNRLSVTSARQRELLKRIEAALDVYVARATRIVDENTRVGSSANSKSVVEGLAQETSQLLGLGRELRTAEQAALDLLVKGSRRSMANLYTHVVVAVGVALVLGLAILRLIHVARIAPLRADLDRSRAILEEHEGLASLGTLAAAVAHEVRNPLTAIKVRLHSLKRAVPENPSANDDLSVIHNEVKRLERLVEDFMRFGRPSPPRMQVFAAATLFEQLKGLLGPQLEAAGVRWQIEAPPGVCVRADRQQLEQVLINLIQNAAENTSRGGSITLRAATCPAGLPFGPAAGTLLEVADTGKGIAPEVAKRMFDPFFSTKERGAGLGLSIVGRIVEKHGGSIRYQTKVGSGTTFSITLPGAEESKHET